MTLSTLHTHVDSKFCRAAKYFYLFVLILIPSGKGYATIPPEDMVLMNEMAGIVWTVKHPLGAGHWLENDHFKFNLKNDGTGDLKWIKFNKHSNPGWKKFKNLTGPKYERVSMINAITLTFSFESEQNDDCEPHMHDAIMFLSLVDRDNPFFIYQIVNSGDSDCTHGHAIEMLSAHGRGTGTGT